MAIESFTQEFAQDLVCSSGILFDKRGSTPDCVSRHGIEMLRRQILWPRTTLLLTMRIPSQIKRKSTIKWAKRLGLESHEPAIIVNARKTNATVQYHARHASPWASHVNTNRNRRNEGENLCHRTSLAVTCFNTDGNIKDFLKAMWEGSRNYGL